MQRSNIIILTDLKNAERQETWGSITEICENHKIFKYSAIKTKKFPFSHEGYLFNKVKYRVKTITT